MKGTNTGIRLTLIKADEWDGNDGKRHRREQWAITGGEVSSKWSRKTDSMGRDLGPHEPGWEPSSRFTLWVVDDHVDPRLASYGGAVWPTAWTDLFQAKHQGTRQATVEITDKGLMFRAAALDGASDMYADVRLL